MEYDASDINGTDDLPRSHHNRGARGEQISGNGTSVVGDPYLRVQNGMENKIHWLEQEAYSSILLAFNAQSNVISWEKESLITEFRKELKISNVEHIELLSRVNADDITNRIREWRQNGELQSGMLNKSQPVHDPASGPTVSASCKRQKTSHSLGEPSPVRCSQGVAISVKPSSTAGKLGFAAGVKSMEHKSDHILPCVSSTKSLYDPSTGRNRRGRISNRASDSLTTTEPAEAAACDPLIGRKIMTRWPDDNILYEAVITDYNPHEGLHALVYDKNTDIETWEWVNLKEIPPEDIQWEGEDPGILHQSDRGDPGRGVKKPTGRGDPGRGVKKPTGGGDGRGRGSLKNQSKKDLAVLQNGIGEKFSDEIVLLHTGALVKEVKRVLGATGPDSLEMESARKVLKEHEQSLIDAIARLADASDGERRKCNRIRPSNPRVTAM